LPCKRTNNSLQEEKAASKIGVAFCFMFDETLTKELQEIFRDEYGLEMPYADAEKAGVWLASFFDALAEEANLSGRDK